ncbi:MAG TPA: DUF4190 domain-containing protein [Jatrophihabitans sp.]|jgi:uncharacterized membrane-anchored protein|nr:DUF4190 domain-containing protein [Jatrophihabitans sp.]
MSYPSAPQVTTPAQGAGTRTNNGMAIAGLVCGLVGLLVAAIVLGPLAIIFGGIGLSRANHGASHRTMSIWAIALGIVDIILWVVLLVAVSKNGGFVI